MTFTCHRHISHLYFPSRRKFKAFLTFWSAWCAAPDAAPPPRVLARLPAARGVVLSEKALPQRAVRCFSQAHRFPRSAARLQRGRASGGAESQSGVTRCGGGFGLQPQTSRCFTPRLPRSLRALGLHRKHPNINYTFIVHTVSRRKPESFLTFGRHGVRHQPPSILHQKSPFHPKSPKFSFLSRVIFVFVTLPVTPVSRRYGGFIAF